MYLFVLLEDTIICSNIWSTLHTPVDPRCRGDYVFSRCPSQCGITCENYDLPPPLRPQCGVLTLCVEGCTCPPGLIPRSSRLFDTTCVRPEECPKTHQAACSQRPETGNCRYVICIYITLVHRLQLWGQLGYPLSVYMQVFTRFSCNTGCYMSCIQNSRTCNLKCQADIESEELDWALHT